MREAQSVVMEAKVAEISASKGYLVEGRGECADVEKVLCFCGNDRVRGHSVSLLALTVVLALNCCTGGEAAFNVSLELQGGHCSDQLTLICRHSDINMAPLWIHNETVEDGDALATAFPNAVYTVQNLTEHTATITGVDNVRALDGCVFQCAYQILGNLIKSNAVKFSFIPPDYRPALSLVNSTADFSERLSAFTYSYQESCRLYPRCTQYFSVEHTVSPQSAVSNSSSVCSVEYTIRNLMRCVIYQFTATALLGSQRGIPIVVGDTVMLSPGPFNITDVSIGADRNLINVTYMEIESDCPGYPTEWYTVDYDEVKVTNLTADTGQFINHADGSVTLSLPLNQPLPKNATTLNMTKYNTVPTNRSDVTGNIVTEMVTWRTSAVFALRESPPGGEPSAPGSDDSVAIAVSVSVGILVLLAVVGGTAVGIVAFINWRNKKKNEKGRVRKPVQADQEAGRHAQLRQHYAELDFAARRPVPPPPSDMSVVAYAEVGQA